MAASTPTARLAAIAAAALCLSTSVACGSRLSHARLLADARGAGGSSNTATPGPTGGTENGQATIGTATGATGNAATASLGTGGDQVAGGGTTVGNPGSTGGTGGSQVGAACSRGTPINIASVGELSGPIGSVLIDGPRAVQAWAAGVNTRGGVNCHRVTYLLGDDGGDPSRHQSLVREMVEQNHVVAFVHMTSGLTGQSSVDYINQKRIPVIGNETGSPWFYQSPMYFPQASTWTAMLAGGLYGAGDVARAAGKTTLGMLTCVEAAICTVLSNLAGQLGPKIGLQVVYRGQGSVAQPDFTADCQAAQQHGAQVLFVGFDPASITRIGRSCSGINYHPLYVAISSDTLPSQASDANLNGMVVPMPVIPWIITGNPAVSEYHQVLQRYAPALTPDAGGIIGWTSAKLFELATQHLPEPPTSQAILDALWSIKNNDLGGLTQPLTFTRDQNAQPVVCYWIAQARDRQWTSPNGGSRNCVP